MHFLFTKIIQTILIILGLIPRTLSNKIACRLGDLWFALDRRHRQVTLNNLELAFGFEKSESERNQLARDVFRNIAKFPFEVAWSARLEEKEFLKNLEIKGLSNLIKAQKKGKGTIMLTAHTGNWELLSFITPHIGPTVNIIYKPIKFKPADDFIYQLRTRFGARMIPKKRTMRRILNCLRRNECVGILFDQDPGLGNGIFVDFFAKPTCTNKILAVLAIKTEAPVIPVFSARRGMKFIVEFGEEIPLSKTSDMEQDIISNTAAYNKSIETFIRKHPDQWFWVHRRWKHTFSLFYKKNATEMFNYLQAYPMHRPPPAA